METCQHSKKIEGWVTAGWCQLLLIMNSVFKAGVRKRLDRHKPCAGLERLVQQHLIHRRCGLMVFGLLSESFYLVARYCSVCSSSFYPPSLNSLGNPTSTLAYASCEVRFGHSLNISRAVL